MIEIKKSEILKNHIVDVLTRIGTPLSRGELILLLDKPPSAKTVQRSLVQLCKDGLVDAIGKHNAKKYFPAYSTVSESKESFVVQVKADKPKVERTSFIFSKESVEKLKFLEIPSFARKKQTYNAFLVESYIPNKTKYISDDIKKAMLQAGLRFDKELAAGTYAKEIVQRLLIDLSYNSSRLEGNTYSLLETQKLLEEGVMLDGNVNEETIMILNHKEGILFLVENATELEVTSFVIRNLHQLLSQDLLNINACGKVRQIPVGISRSSYIPLNNAQQLEEGLMLILRKAHKIKDPFEQSFFLLMHLSYLQAFEDVNKRTARLTCNIPFIKMNLCPLSFVDVKKEDYIRSLLYFYETGNFEPALELFQFAYMRSCEKYVVVKKSIGQIDTYRVKYRKERKEILGEIIRGGLIGSDIELALDAYCTAHKIENEDKFISIALTELNNIHSGAVIGLGVTEGMLLTWLKAQNVHG